MELWSTVFSEDLAKLGNESRYLPVILSLYIYSITTVIPKGLGRHLCLTWYLIVYPHLATYCFKFNVIGSEPIAINWAQIQSP